MSSEGHCDKQQVSLRILIETVRKTVKSFGRESDNGEISPAIIRALEEATRDVSLTKRDYEEIAAAVKENQRKRKEKRSKK